MYLIELSSFLRGEGHDKYYPIEFIVYISRDNNSWTGFTNLMANRGIKRNEPDITTTRKRLSRHTCEVIYPRTRPRFPDQLFSNLDLVLETHLDGLGLQYEVYPGLPPCLQ